MMLVSTEFFLFLAATVVLYYIFPKKIRFAVLCIASMSYMFLADGLLGLSVLVGYIILLLFLAGILQMDSLREKTGIRRLVYIISMLLPIAGLVVFKYVNLFHVSTPMGIAFYLMTAMGFMTDVYQESVQEKIHPGKAGLLIGFFPLMTSGPILRYGQSGDALVNGHAICYENIVHGALRILWGVFKKIVISERCAVIVNTVFASPAEYSRQMLIFGALLFALQLYTDFSGCMDIVLGAAKLFGIELPENFDTPFFSRNVSEFWRRWHITLGAWLKDYVMYPVLHSELFRKFKKSCKKKLSRKNADKPALYLAMLISWSLIGLWHGGSLKYIFGVGIWFYLVIVLGELLLPLTTKLKNGLHIKTNNTSYHIFESLRTLLIVVVGLSFFRADSFLMGVDYWKQIVIGSGKGILFSNDIYALGLDLQDLLVLIVAFLILLLVSVIQYKRRRTNTQGSFLGWLDQQNVAFRWAVYIILIFSVFVFGKYGQGYQAADFIYQGF